MRVLRTLLSMLLLRLRRTTAGQTCFNNLAIYTEELLRYILPTLI